MYYLQHIISSLSGSISPSLPPTLLLTLLVFPVPVATTAWQVTDDANNSGCGCPCSVEHKQHDKLPSSVCFANSPHRSPPRPVVTFCCVLYMQIPANQLARCSPCSPRCPLWLKWIDCRLKSTPASLPEAEGSAGHDKVNGQGRVPSYFMFLFSISSLVSCHHNCSHKTQLNLLKMTKLQWKQTER